jgi:hypothetical protein
MGRQGRKFRSEAHRKTFEIIRDLQKDGNLWIVVKPWGTETNLKK